MRPRFPTSPVRVFVAAACVVVLMSACQRRQSPAPADTVVIGIAADVNSFNPLFASEVTAGEINELLYPMLVNSEFDTVSGALTFSPGLARRWEFERSGRDLRFHLNTLAKWSDNTPIGARDVQYTFELYADPEVGSVWQSALDGLQRGSGGALDIRRAVEIVNDSTVVFHFKQAYPGQLFDVGLPILPAHVFSSIPKEQLRSHPINQNPVGAGPFRLERHVSMQEIVLSPNPTSVLPYPSRLQRLVFRIIPDYRSRLLQLGSGAIDFMSAIETEDIPRLQDESSNVDVIPTPPRRYHFIGWNNIDPGRWAASRGRQTRAHPLFGSTRVRRALSMAINRNDLTQALLGPYGIPAFGPVSPIFRTAYDDSLRPLPYDPTQALALLKEEGWTDTDGNGMLEKDGKLFSFALKVPGGNVLWSEIATVVQKQLRDIHIEARIELVERSVFWPDLLSKKYDAWIAGFEVPLEPRLDDMWGSDLQKNPFNVLSYRSASVDRLLARLRQNRMPPERAVLLREIQRAIADDQPCTFLFWERGRIGVNKRVHGIHSTVLALTHDAWDWQVTPEK